MRPHPAWVLLVTASCGGGAPSRPSPPPVATVRITYRSHVPESPPPLTDPELLAAEAGCVHHYSAVGGVYVLEGSWSERARYRNPEGECHRGCTFEVPGVPVGVEHAARVLDLGLCHVAPFEEPFTLRTILANGVELTRIVDHPSGLRGVAFRVAADGAVTP